MAGTSELARETPEAPAFAGTTIDYTPCVRTSRWPGVAEVG